MKLYIKNMVCGRCEMALTSELEKWGSLFFLFNWGSEIATDLDDSQKQMLSKTEFNWF
jgi:copper chaperone CopZ